MLFSKIFIAICTLFGGIMAGSSTAWAQETPRLNLGVVLPLSGSQQAFGKEALRGIELALADLAKEDEKLAANVRLLKEDDKSQTHTAKEATDDLLSKKRAHVIIGSISSAATAAAAEAARKHGRPLVSPLAADPQLARGGGVFRIPASDAYQGVLLARFAASSLKAKKAAILRDETEASESMAKSFQKIFTQAGGKIVHTEVYPVSTTDFAVLLSRLAKAKPDVILAPVAYRTAGAILKKAEAMGIDAAFLGGHEWDSPALAKAAGSAAQGHYFAAHFALDADDEKTKAFVKSFESRYGRAPGAVAALAYDAAGLVFDAVRRARSTLKTPLMRAFKRTSGFSGVTGTITYNDKGSLLKSGIIKETRAGGIRFKARVTPAG